MLNTLTRKLGPYLSFAALTLSVGCGKKIEDPSIAPIVNIENQERNSLLILRLQSAHITYPMKQFASFKMPSELKVNLGITTGRIVTAIYDLDATGAYQVKCTYKGNAAGDRILLTKCVDDMNQDYGSLDRLLDATFYVHPHNYIRLQNANADLDVEALYQVTWAS